MAKKRRRGLNPDLTPASVLEQAAGRVRKEAESDVSELPASPASPDVPVLPKVFKGRAAKHRAVLDADGVPDGQRTGDAVPQEVPDRGRVDAEGGGSFPRLFRRLLDEQADPRLQSPGDMAHGGVTNRELIARQVIREAVEGRQWAINFVRDAVEGRPGTAPPPTSEDRGPDLMLDALLTDKLNKLGGVDAGGSQEGGERVESGGDGKDNAGPEPSGDAG